MIEAAAPGLVPPTLTARYRPQDLSVFDSDERKRFLDPFGETALDALRGNAAAWAHIAPFVAWELLYRLEPELYDRLIAGERIHPDVLARLPHAQRAVEIAAGTGRLTVDLLEHCDALVAVEPAAPLRERLRRRVGADVRSGFFDAIPIEDRWSSLTVSCSAFTSEEAHGGETGLREMERVTARGGVIAFVWPADVDWLAERGFTYESFDGEMCVEFASVEEAVELARVFYPHASDEIARRGEACVPYEVLGMNAPRDLAYKVL